MPNFEAFLEFEVKNGKGELVHCHRQRSHSWVRNAYNFMASLLMAINGSDGAYGAGNINAKDTDGTTRSASNAMPRWDLNVENVGAGYRGGATVDTLGVVVGSGTNAESFEHYALQTKITNGVGAGQLSYVEQNAPARSYDAGTKVYRVQLVRYFNNNSGGDVNVNEVAIYSAFYPLNGWKAMVSRDKLVSTVTVPNSGQLKVTYTIQLTYPA